jgi:hypothetical protein
MPTDKQIEASRTNGVRSRDPVTPQGKANSIRKSCQAQLANAIVGDGESSGMFHNLVGTLNESLNPETAIDQLLIGKMAAAHWRQIRIWELEKRGANNDIGAEMRLDRQFVRTLNAYHRLRPAKNSEPLNPLSI